MGSEPTNPNGRRLSREEMAHRDVGKTNFSRGAALALGGLFVATIALVPAIQFVSEIRGGETAADGWKVPQALELRTWPLAAVRVFANADGSWWTKLNDANHWLLQQIDRYEDALEDGSVLSQAMLPPTQLALARIGAGNEKAYIGRDGWLFYRPDVEYVTSGGFLERKRLTRRLNGGSETEASVQPDPRKTIIEFRNQLAKREIELVVVPTPSKASVHPEKFFPVHAKNVERIQNPSFDAFLADLESAGVRVFDPATVLLGARKRSGADQYLISDTHWSPEAMELVASRLAEFAMEHALLDAAGNRTYEIEETDVSNLGDVAVMLRLPEGQDLFHDQTVTVRRVVDPSGAWFRSDKDAEVLVLGDSFSNIFSLGGMGWSDSAGFVEHLAFNLRRPVDAILRNDDGAHATREILSRELANGRDRLAGKKLVIWQFAARELAFGDWKSLPLELGAPVSQAFFVPSSGESLSIAATVREVSSAPRPGSVPYKDHIMALHLTDLVNEAGELVGANAVVYMWSMKDNIQTGAARLRPGDTVNIHLRPWSNVADERDRFNRSELSDETLQFEEPCWGDAVETTP